jgi:hypothetical protein
MESCTRRNSVSHMSLMRGIRRQLFRNQSSSLSSQPGMFELARCLQNSSVEYPSFICVNNCLSTDKYRVAATISVGTLSGKDQDGKWDNASTTVLSWPGIYLIVMLYCDKNSCQHNCLRDRSFWTSKFSNVLWSVYMKK